MVTPGFPEKLLQGLAAPLAGLFLVLALFAAAPGPAARGVRVELLRQGPSECGDTRPVVIHFEEGGSVWINEENVGARRAPQAVSEIMATRAERAVFLLPGKETSVQEVTSLADSLHSAVADLRIGVVTNRQLESTEREESGMKYVPIDCMAWPRYADPVN